MDWLIVPRPFPVIYGEQGVLKWSVFCIFQKNIWMKLYFSFDGLEEEEEEEEEDHDCYVNTSYL